jgi:hypothetical protein
MKRRRRGRRRRRRRRRRKESCNLRNTPYSTSYDHTVL